jgi:hypothetical protein
MEYNTILKPHNLITYPKFCNILQIYRDVKGIVRDPVKIISKNNRQKIPGQTNKSHKTVH